MTHGYGDSLKSKGIRVSEPRSWPVEWVNFRLHPCPHWPGVEAYRTALQGGASLESIVLCSHCYVILDGWHRMAAHWLEGRRFVTVQFADTHWMGGKEHCRVDKTHWIETIRPWTEMDCVSGAYHKKDWKYAPLVKLRDELMALGQKFPTTRLWEQARAILFLGNVRNKRILDVGTRESMVPAYLALQGAYVTSIDLTFINRSIVMELPTGGGTCTERGDAREMVYSRDSFDHVICTACVKHIPGWGDRQAVKEMVRVLKPGGLLAISTNYGQEYTKYPCPVSKSRTYDKKALYSRLILPSRCLLQGPVDFDRSDWNAWPIKIQARRVYDAGLNIQVAFILLRKPL